MLHFLDSMEYNLNALDNGVGYFRSFDNGINVFWPD